MKSLLHLLFIIQLIFIQQNIYSQNRKDLIYEYKKMISNAGYLAINFQNNVNQYSNKEISDLLSRAWIKKQIIILLQMQNYLQNPICYIQATNDTMIMNALLNFKNEMKIDNNLAINQQIKELLWKTYLTNAKTSVNALPYLLHKKNIMYNEADLLIQIFKKELEFQV